MGESNLFKHRSPSLVVLTLLILGPSLATAQGPTLTPYGGYRLGGALGISEGDLRLDESPFFGVQLDARARPDATGSLIVDYQPTTLRLKVSGSPAEQLFDINVWYFQVGGLVEFPQGQGAVPFMVASLGMSWFDPADGSQNAESEYGFAGILGVGAKIPISAGGAGLRLQARVLANMINGRSDLWCGGGGRGCYVGIGGPIGPVQFDFGGGLTFGGR
jgi:hypothetical protein